MDFIDFIRTSFWHVAPILIAMVIALAITIERTKSLYRTYSIGDVDDFFEKVGSYVLAGKVSEAIAICDRNEKKPIARIVKQGLLRAHMPEELIESGLAIEVNKSVHQLQQGTSFLATIANVVTLLGLFGTIAGLIHSFEAVGQADAQQKSALLAAGISQAMNATMLGLAVAIPCMVAFSFLANKTNKLVSDVERAAIKTMDMLRSRYYSVERSTSSNKKEAEELEAAS